MFTQRLQTHHGIKVKEEQAQHINEYLKKPAKNRNISLCMVKELYNSLCLLLPGFCCF
jgi:hypothetical protein